MRSEEDQKTATLREILAEESHKTPDKILARDDCAPQQDPCRALGKALARTSAGPLPGPRQPSFPLLFACSGQPNQLGWHLRGNMRLPDQISKCLRGGTQTFVKTLPPRHLSCLPAYMALHASLARARVDTRRSGDGRDGSRSRPR